MDIMPPFSLVLDHGAGGGAWAESFNAMLAIAIVRIPFYCRRARKPGWRQFTYVQAARTFGARWHLISWHILRNALPPLTCRPHWILAALF